jgi:YD repeat-containing protein
MRRFAVAMLLVIFISQSSGYALAGMPGDAPNGLTWGSLLSSVNSLSGVVSAVADEIGRQIEPSHAEQSVDGVAAMRSRRLLRPRPRPGTPEILRLPPRTVLTSRERPPDPRAMRRATVTPRVAGSMNTLAPGLRELGSVSAPSRQQAGALPVPTNRHRIKSALASSGGTGIEHWWTYEEQQIPGIGKALLNVGTGNLLASASDVDLPEQGINLVFRRVYNSQSLHDTSGDDGGDPAIFGNGWTNNFDANIVYNATAGTITVYDLDGTACTYTANISGGWTPCTGEYATLAPVPGSQDCQYTWTKPNGTVYVFENDGGALGLCTAGNLAGHLVEILSRNTNNYITFTYYYDSSGQRTSEHITEIDADHSDGDKLTMIFGVVPGTSFNELSTITRPDQAVLQYWYDPNGNLLEVDKPGNNSASNLPGNPHPSKDWQQGDLPESYAYYSGGYQLEEACGPRCTASTWANGSPIDGAAITFQYTGSQLVQWQVQGVLNFTPDDQTGIPLNAAKTGWHDWNTTTFQYGSSGLCGSSGSSTTYMCDQDGHQTIWVTDNSARVTQTKRLAGSQFLKTQQVWDGANNLISTTDANGNVTQYGYDGYGNMVETQLPNATDFTIGSAQNQSLMPLSFYSYDTNNNVVAYCDPYWTNKHGKSWVSNPTDSLCPSTQGTTYFTYKYDQTNEPYGCLTDTYKPGGYHTGIGYGGSSCVVGLPAKVQGDVIPQFGNQPSRRPTQDFAYNQYGQLTQYDRGQDTGSDNFDSWTLAYNQNGNHDNLNTQRTENDSTIGNNMKSFTCYYPDGSIFYTETPSQHDVDQQLCPTTASLLAGPVSPPAEATAHYYDYDGDEVKIIDYRGCSSNNVCTSKTSKTKCSSSEGSQPIGTTCKYYDGLDRLVETAQPYDNRSFSDGTQYEFYAFRWMNRYIYDLSLNGADATLSISDPTGSTNSFVAFGNLYKTEEYLPQFSNMHGCYAKTNDCQKPSGGQYSGASWSDVRGTSFDSLDRPVNKYELAFGLGYVTSNAYDGSGQLGQLSSVTNAMGQKTTYSYDPIGRVLSTQFSRGDGDSRSYQYDPDGRTASITAGFGAISYTYDLDGNELTATEPTKQQGYDGGSFICYEYYPDGLREYLTIGSAGGGYSTCSQVPNQGNPGNDGISQYRLFSYSYRNDGLLATQQVNWNGAQINQQTPTFSFAYTPSGRELSENDPLTETTAYPPYSTGGTQLIAKQYSYDSYGRVAGLQLPGLFKESSLVYDEEDQLAGYTAGLGNLNGINRPIIMNSRGEVIQDGSGLATQTQAETQSGNGAQVGNGDSAAGTEAFQAPPTTTEYDLRSNMVTCSTDPAYAKDYSSNTVYPYVYQYDHAGRLTLSGSDQSSHQSGSTSCDPSQAANPSTYDAENHIQSSSINQAQGTATWGPDGRQRIALVNGLTQTAHWDGDSLLFATGGNVTTQLYIGKLGVMDSNGDIDIYDRDQTGAKASSHGYVSADNYRPGWMDNTNGIWLDSWSLGSVRTVQAYKNGQQYYLQYFTGTCNAYFLVGNNTSFYACPAIAATFEMGRADGYKMVGGIVQGARSFDPTSGQWLTPDAYAGDVKDPMTQKPFVWNGNNPVTNEDPSGYDIGYIDNGLVNMLADMINNSTIFRDAFLAMAQDHNVTYNFSVGHPSAIDPLTHKSVPVPGQGTLSGDNRTFEIQIAPGSRMQEEDEEAHEAGGHGDLLATEGAQAFRNDAKNHSMCAGNQKFCNNNEIKAQEKQQAIDQQLGIPFAPSYTPVPVSMIYDFNTEFEQNAQESQEFLHQGEEYVY